MYHGWASVSVSERGGLKWTQDDWRYLEVGVFREGHARDR